MWDPSWAGWKDPASLALSDVSRSHFPKRYKGLQQPLCGDLWRPFSSSSEAIIRAGLLHGDTLEIAMLGGSKLLLGSLKRL